MESPDKFAFLLPFFMLCFSILFLAARRVDKGASLFWGFGFLSAALGFVAPLGTAALSPVSQSIISNLLFYSAFFFYGHGLLTHFGAPLIVVPRLLTALAFVVVATLLLMADNVRSHLALSDLGCATLLLMAFTCCLRQMRRPADKALMLAVGCVISETLLRIAMLLFHTGANDPISLEAFFASDYAFFMQLLASIFGFLLGLAALATVVTDIVEKHQELAERDPLTDLLNRRGFERVVADAPDAGSIVVCDIDHFKSVNDRYGHATGDLILRDVAARLKIAFPVGTVLARFGGEEFVAYLPTAELGAARQMAESARQMLAKRSFASTDGRAIPITASFGVAPALPGAASIHDTIAHADVCLYMAKSEGRNRVVVHGLRESAAAQARSGRVQSQEATRPITTPVLKQG